LVWSAWAAKADGDRWPLQNARAATGCRTARRQALSLWPCSGRPSLAETLTGPTGKDLVSGPCQAGAVDWLDLNWRRLGNGFETAAGVPKAF
jgi:hypothetical protein